MKNTRMTLGELALIASGLLTILVVAIVDYKINPVWNVGRAIGFTVFMSAFTWLCFLEDIQSKLMLRGLMAVQIVCAFYLFVGFPFEPIMVLLVVTAGQVPYVAGRYSHILLVLVNIPFFVYSSFYSEMPLHTLSLVMFLGFQLFAGSSSQARKEAKENKEELEAVNLKLHATQALLAQQSQQQERLRIARDLHDSIGHRLTALSLQLEHAKHQNPESFEPWRAELGEQVKGTLGQLREIVKATRQQGEIELVEVLKRLQTSLPKNIQLLYPESLPVNDPELGEQLAFCMQEAISNALRHGGADRIEISSPSAAPLQLKVRDNGRSIQQWQAGSGLLGMRERLKEYGGSVELSPNGQGMDLNLITAVSR
ncbi:sensor histidine kinase [Pseudoteredinibacter isoporae]|uniref:Signal transduction histidine kinase n=1 Tax=Pseudoteredinibacter isoporae TaxID=570281 RepID=A0A7X0MZ17_9GAMM|nr:histidine kinase [Pseudoteredinibacter isoporae]MBB6523684.1 signal transduction histidine kinase [Pseudoteredinibacter isoporae]NHO89187.1 hypothetical protein [Pseudoteredinibacter isoporae]NIB22202.1 hypothetical protein [Pseudoteredinibacter isoporae]